MSDLQFQEPQYGMPAGPKRSWLTGLVIKTGLASDDAGAQKVMLIIAIIAGIAALWVAFSSGGPVHPVRGPIPKGTSLTVPG